MWDYKASNHPIFTHSTPPPYINIVPLRGFLFYFIYFYIFIFIVIYFLILYINRKTKSFRPKFLIKLLFVLEEIYMYSLEEMNMYSHIAFG